MKKIYLSIVACAISVTLFAQPTITSNQHTPTNNFSYTDNIVPESAAVFSSDGANQVWDYSQLTSSGTVVNTISTTIPPAFSAATHVSMSSSAKQFSRYSSTGMELVGMEIPSQNFSMKYSNPEKTLYYPVVMNQTFTDDFSADYVLQGMYDVVRHGNTTYTVKGYGTLKLPNQTLTDVVKYELVQDYVDDISEDGSPFMVIDYVSKIEIYIKAGYPAYLASINSLTANGSVSKSGTYVNTILTELSTEGIQGLSDFVVVGNPVKDVLKFRLASANAGEVSYALMDLTGREVLQEASTALLTGENEISMNVTAIPAGFYCLRIQQGNSMLNKLVIIE